MAVVTFRITGRVALTALIAFANIGCVEHGQPPVVERSPVFSPLPETYLVHVGDSLYSIAWRFDLDFRVLARSNGLRSPYIIQPGQRLRLSIQGKPTIAETRIPSPRDNGNPLPRRTGPGLVAHSSAWQWPTDAPVSKEYGRGNSGIDFALATGHRVRAAAAGTVVYSGNGLGGYRHLTIIKHSDAYLSAYSLNVAPSVAEGDSIEAGGLIAHVGGRGPAPQTLHFEIRKEGDPVSPRAVIGP
ncbi:MAG: peptidoglycan DD-metalloendopeptidase family protein [Gammaproteobacteria bacterium]|nr:peptidoglycan DD-metalloendopeptidase family protein [Gammaproteobacteria bacterium]